MLFTETALKGAYVVDIERHDDERGFFARVFCRNEFDQLGLESDMVQANAANSLRRGTVRGMHFQYPTAPEAKLVRCLSGAIVDVIVDLRPESPTWLQHVAVELNAQSMRALYVPPRFAHGYQTLCDETAILYQASGFYAPQAAGGLRHDDPRLGIEWPIAVTVVSPRDAALPLLDDLQDELKARMSGVRSPATAMADA